MRNTRIFVGMGSLIVSCILLAGPAQILGQQTQNNQGSLTLKHVKQKLSQYNQYLKQAAKEGKAGDSAGLTTALNNYSRGMQGLNTALSQGHFNGTPSQEEQAYNRVKKATQKHINVLEGLLNNSKIPAQGKAGITKALSASQNGQAMALSHLKTLQTQRSMEQANRPGFSQTGGMGRPEGVGGGMSGGAGSMGAGMGHGMGGGMGAGGGMGHAGGGPHH